MHAYINIHFAYHRVSVCFIFVCLVNKKQKDIIIMLLYIGLEKKMRTQKHYEAYYAQKCAINLST